MKKLLIIILVLSSLMDLSAQSLGTSITNMPTYIGNPSGWYLPIATTGSNRKFDAGKLGYNKMDSIAVSGSTISVYKNGAVAFTVDVPSGETATSIRNKIGAATSSNSGYLASADWVTFNSKQAALGFTAENTAKRGAANGYAPLDASSKIPTAYLPTTPFSYVGTWNASTNTPTLSDATGTNGQVVKVGIGGTQNLGSGSITYAVGDELIHNGTIWQKTSNTSAVSSVAGKAGVVTLDAGDISETSTRVWVSPTEKGVWNGKQAALGFTPLSNVAGAVTNTSLASGIDATKITTGILPIAQTPAFIGDVTKAAGANTLVLASGIDPAKLSTGVVNTTEFNALDGVTSAIQTQINAKSPSASPTFTGIPTVPTALAGTATGQAASTLFVQNSLGTLPGLNFNSPSNGFRIIKAFNDTTFTAKTFEGGTNVSLDSTTKPNTIIVNAAITAPSTGYTLMGGLTPFTPAVSTTYYLGSTYGLATSTPGINRMYIPKAGTIKVASIFYSLLGGTLGSATELTNFRLAVRSATTGTTTNYTIQNQNWGAVREGRIVNKTMTVAVAQDDYVELLMTFPASYATLPTQARFSFIIYIE